MSYEAIRFKEEAAACRRLAAQMESSIQRAHYLGWAEEYERLAVECERKASSQVSRGRLLRFGT